MFASNATAKSSKGSELFNISQESFQVLVDAFDSTLSPPARVRNALKVWVAVHGIVMLTKQGLLRGGRLLRCSTSSTRTALDRLSKCLLMGSAKMRTSGGGARFGTNSGSSTFAQFGGSTC